MDNYKQLKDQYYQMYSSIRANANTQPAYQTIGSNTGLDNSWYSGSQPTSWEIRRRIGQISLEDPEEGDKLYSMWVQEQNDPYSQYYNKYMNPTNRAADYLAANGFNTDLLTNGWLNTTDAQGYIQSNLVYDGATNTPKSPGKKATFDEINAYWLDQYIKAEPLTQGAVSDLDKMSKQIDYLVNSDKNYSNEQIIDKIRGVGVDENGNKIFTNKNLKKDYPSLYEVETSTSLLELNQGIDFSDDIIEGMIWASRNGGGTGNMESDAIMAAVGYGNAYMEDPAITEKLQLGSPSYAPYYVGATMDEDLSYFGLYSADQKWVDDNFMRIMAGNDEEAKEHAKNIDGGVTYTAKLNSEREAMQKQIDGYISKGFTNADFIINKIREDTDAYGDLFELDKTMNAGEQYGDLKPTTDKVPYKWQDVENEIRERCEKENNKRDAMALAENRGYPHSTKPTSKPSARESVNAEPKKVNPSAGPGPETPTDLTPVTYTENGIDAVSGAAKSTASVNTSTEPASQTAGPEPKGPANLAPAKPSGSDGIDSVSDAAKSVLGSSSNSVEPKPLFTETEKANEEAFKNDIQAVSPTINDVGTEAEKTAMMTGKTSYYDLCVQQLRDRVDNIADSFVSKTSSDIETKYFGDAKAVFEYKTRKDRVQDNQSKLDEIMPEWEKLSSKIAENEAVSSMSSDEYANLIEFANANTAEHPGWDIIKREIELGPGEPDPYDDSNDRTLGYSYALNALYDIVTGGNNQDISDEEKQEKAKNWYGYLTKASPVEQIVKDANKTSDDVDELEIEQDGMLIRLEKNDSGRFEFSGAVDTRTGDAYGADRMSEVDEKLGSNALSDEEGARFTELNRIKNSLEEAIMDDQDYLGAYQEEYENANRESNFIKLSFAEAVRSAQEQGIDIDPLLIQKIDKFTSAAGTPVDTQQSAYNYYDEAVEQKLYTGEEVTNAAIENAASYEKEAQDLKDVLVSFDRMGIAVSDEDRANIQAHISQYNSMAKEAGYVALDGNEDFDDVVENTYQKVKSHEIDVDVSDMVETALTGKTSAEIGLQSVLGKNNIVSRLINLKDTADTIISGQEMTKKEWDRFYYILGTDGKEEAQKYLDYLLNPKSGMVTMRSSIDKAKWWEEYASANPVSGFIAGRVAGVLSTPAALGYRLGQKVRGESVNGYDRAYDFMNAKAAADKGAASAVTDFFGGAKVAGDIYNITAGITDMAISRRIIGTAVEDLASIVQDSPLGIAISGLKNSANATANAAASKVFDAAESLGANFEEAFKLSYDAGVKAAASSAAGKGLKVVNLLEKGVIDVTSVLPMALNSAEQTYHNVQMTSGEEAAEKMSAVEFFTSLISHTVVFRGIHKAFAANPGSVASGVSGFMEQLLTNEVAVGASGLATNTIKSYAEKAILKADSQYGKDVEKYKEEGFSNSVAEKLADQDMQDNIFRNTFEEMANAALRTGITYAAGVGINAVKNYRASRESNEVKDLSIINNTYGSSPTATAVGLSAVLENPDTNVSKAAGQSFVALCGDADVAASAMQMMIANTPNPEETKSDIIVSSLVDGAGKDALTSIVSKVMTGQQITAADINTLHNGVEEDRNTSPEGIDSAVAAAVKENRIANLTNRILTLPANKNRIETAEANAADKKRNADAANDYMIQKQNEAQAAAENLMSAEFTYNPSEDTQTGGPLQQQTEKLLGADTAATQAEYSYKQQQQIADEAQKKLDDTRREVTTSARQEATVQVEQEMADEQAVRDQQAQAAAEAEQQYQTLMTQEADAEAATRAANVNEAKRIIGERTGMTGEQLERNAQRLADLMEQQKRGELDTDKTLANQDDAKGFMRSISRQTGMTFTDEDLGDPLKVRSMIVGKNNIILNSRISTAQALLEAANHEVIHGLEDTGAYVPFSDVVLKMMYGGRGTDAYNQAIRQKIQEYGSVGKALGANQQEVLEGAEHELVAEYGRLNKVNKKFIRKVVSRGIGTQTKDSITKSLSLLKGYKFKGAAKREVNNLQKAERLYMEAIDERARMVKDGYNGHTGMTQFSITSAAQSVGLTVEVTDDDDYRYKLYDKEGNEIAPGGFTPDMVKGTAAGKVIDLAEKYSTAPNKAEVAETQRKFMSDIINMIGQYQDAAMVWELAGSLAFSTLKTNGDPQYTDSEDMGTICTKTQAILNVISDTQVRLGRGLTKKEIDGIVYNEVGKGVYDEETGKWKHGATPCPPCYVYATWVNKPARLEMIRQYQNKFGDWTSEQINEFMNAPTPSSKKAATERNRQKLWISTCLADEQKDPETGESTWTRKDNPSICPDEILLDLRRSGDMATQYPGTWKFMQKGGNAQGKAIAPYSDSRMGETIVGKAIGAGELNARLLADAQNEGNPDYIPQYLNPFLTGDDAKAEEYFVKALAKAKAQNLKGGQRWQSWSDARAEWGSDYLMEMLTMQALGAQVQTYTKVPEMLPLLASAGFEVNMSLMPEGDGFAHNEDGSIKMDEDGNPVLAFSKVTGINPEAAEAFAKQYGEKGNVQPMVVGISDEHIKAALAGDYLTFVIPFHGSGGSVKRLQHLMALLKEKMDSGNDYTKAQNDKFLSGETNTNPNWALREAILTGEADKLTEDQMVVIEDNEYLSKLYEDRYINEDSPAYQVFFSKGEAQQIYPYEYWDKNTTLATADENSKRFIQYCDMLGVIPRFSGLQKKNGTEYANFSGRKVNKDGSVTYEPVKGYWKLLIDRPMYKRIYDENGKLIKDQCTYRDPEAVNVGNIEVTAMPMAANNTVGHSDDETRMITDRVIQQILLNKGPATASYSGNITLGNTPSEERIENAPLIKQAMYADSDVHLSGPGDLTDSELLSLADEVEKAVQDLGTEDNAIITETINGIENEFDPTIYNGKLYVKPDTLDFWLSKEGFVLDDPNSAQAYITTMDPNDFLRITTAVPEGREKLMGEVGTLDEEKLSQNAKVQPIELFINEETGKITGHEGRHRSIALAKAGVTEIPVLLFDRRTETSKTPKDTLTLEGQDTKRRHESNVKNEETITFSDVIPLSNAYRDELYQRFTASDEERQAAEQNQQRILDYSIGGELSDAELLSLAADNGLISPELIPYSYVPSTNVNYGTKYRQFGRQTAQRGNALHEQAKEHLYNNSQYDPKTNGEQIDRAIGWVQSLATESDPDGYYAALNEILSDNFNPLTTDGQVRMLTVLSMAAMKAEAGDKNALQDEIRISDVYNKQRTEVGRMLQAGNIFHLMTPVGRKALLQSEADRINQDLADRGKKYRVSIPDDMLEEAANAKTVKEFRNVRKKIQRKLNEQLPVTWAERIIGLRMLSMLSAPKTHFRNIAGNLLFMPVVGTKNKVAAIGEIIYNAASKSNKSQEDRTVTNTRVVQDVTFSADDLIKSMGWHTKYEGVRHEGFEDYASVTGVYNGDNKIGELRSGKIYFDSPLWAKLLVEKGYIKKGNLSENGHIWSPETQKRTIQETSTIPGEKQITRTKTLGLSNPEARNFAKARVDEIEDILRGNVKYGEGDQRQQERKIFGTKDDIVSKTFGKALQWWYDANGKALEWEDWIFLKGHYVRALGGYMTANGLKPEDMKGETLEKAELYAIKEAHKATYRDESGVANWMNRIGSKKTNADNNKVLSVIQWIVNTRFPFKRTPINIAKRGIEYSPVGLAKSLTYDLAHLKQYFDAQNGKLEKVPKSAISPTEWIDRFSAGLTGTGIMIAGVVAAALGIARAGLDNKDPEDQIAKMAGEQEYSIRPGKLTDLELIDEDVSMTLDWAAPVVLPFFTGVGLKEYLEKKGFSIGGTLDLTMEVTDPMMNMSFMEGVSDIFKNNGYSNKDGFWQFIEKTAINFATSLIPTWSGQLSNIVNGSKTTYSGGESFTGDPDIDKMIQQVGNKLSWLGLDFGGIPYTNMLGEEQEPVIASWAEQLVSPAYFSRVDESDEMKELARLYLLDPEDNKAIIPSEPDHSIKVDKQTIQLDGGQYTKLKADHGAVWRETTQKLISNPSYEMASDESRAAMFNLADSYATAIAKKMTDSRYKLDSWVESAYRNGNADDAIVNMVAAKNKQVYVDSQAKSFAEALMTNNAKDIKKYADELTESKADPSEVRKQLTAYFKPLYKEAYNQGDDTTMWSIEQILSTVNDYLSLEKPITKYTTKKDFEKWITSTNTVTDSEDKDENNWLNP